MMNNSPIEWCDRSWNPITGCRHSCPYCYARKQSRRFCGDFRFNLCSEQVIHEGDGLYRLPQPFRNDTGKVIPMPTGFNSTLHEYRLGDPAAITKKSVNIFVGSMADVFGDWVPDSWIEKVFEACAAAPWHHYLFLTKNPARYVQLEEAGRLPKAPNMWYGVTASNAAEWDAYQIMGELPTQYKTFVSIEPLQEDITETQCWQDMMATWPWMDWVIIGAERGNRKEKVIPKREWVGAIIAQCEVTARPVFLKDNIAGVWGGEPIQEFPKGLLPRPKPRPRHQVKIEAVRDAKDCDSCGTHLQGKPAYRLGARKYECVSCFEKLEAESWQNLQK